MPEAGYLQLAEVEAGNVGRWGPLGGFPFHLHHQTQGTTLPESHAPSLTAVAEQSYLGCVQPALAF